MPIRSLIAMGAATLSLTACATVVMEEPEPEPVPVVDACNSAAYQQFVGERSPVVSVPAGTAFRHYRSGDPVTMDLNPARLNFEYDRSGVLIKVSCG